MFCKEQLEDKKEKKMTNLLRQATLKGTVINDKYQEFRRTN